MDGGPRLDVAAPELEEICSRDEPHSLAGPHLSLGRQGEDVPHPEKPPQPVCAESRETAPTPAADKRRIEKGSEHLLVAVGLEKSYRKGDIEVPVLAGVNIGVRQGEFIAVVGQSGSGKSTLLHLLGTLDAPDQGEIHFDGQRIDNQPVAVRDALRNKRFGMIFQFYHLLPELTTLENVLVPLMITHNTLNYLRHHRRHRRAAAELLETVGLGHRLKHRPRELSGGEMQRAAIARALIAQPDLLLADEPTGNLDHSTGKDIMRILRTLNDQQDLTIVMVTHDRSIAEQADRIVRLVDGRIET